MGVGWKNMCHRGKLTGGNKNEEHDREGDKGGAG